MALSAGGVSFQRAAHFYDRTRGLPGDTTSQVAKVLTDELAGRGHCLEIGVGTGRIALPLHRSGVSLLGTDIAPAMLARLIENAGGQAPFPLMLADATRLPLARASVGAVLACHVLHLIPNWRAATDEAMRVLRPGGVLLVDFGGGSAPPWHDAAMTVMKRHGIAPRQPGVSSPTETAAHLAGRAVLRALPPVPLRVPRSLREDLDGWERQISSWTWPYSPAQMHAACAEIREWAPRNGWDLDDRPEVDQTLQWWAFERKTGQT